MKPPKAPVAGDTAEAAEAPSAVLSCPDAGHVTQRMETLRKRADFLRAAKSRRLATKGFVLQARKRRAEDVDPEIIRVGFTCSKKVGNAVARNRAKRRLRAIAQAVIPLSGMAGWDYVLIGRAGSTADLPYIEMVNSLHQTLHKIHETGK